MFGILETGDEAIERGLGNSEMVAAAVESVWDELEVIRLPKTSVGTQHFILKTWSHRHLCRKALSCEMAVEGLLVRVTALSVRCGIRCTVRCDLLPQWPVLCEYI